MPDKKKKKKNMQLSEMFNGRKCSFQYEGFLKAKSHSLMKQVDRKCFV